jgi:hypothetical protein
MNSKQSGKENQRHRLGFLCRIAFLVSATVIVVALVFLLPSLFRVWNSEFTPRRELAIKRVVSGLIFYSKSESSESPLHKQELEEMLRERGEGRDASFSLFKIESNEIYIILLIPRPRLNEDSLDPIV